MRDEQGRCAATQPEVLADGLDLLADLDIEGRKRFVHEDDPRSEDEGARQGDALLHPTRQFVNPSVSELLELDHFEMLEDPLLTIFPRDACHPEPEFNVACHIEPWNQGPMLGHNDYVRTRDLSPRTTP